MDALGRLELADIIKSESRAVKRRRRLAVDVSKSQIAKLEAVNARLHGLSIKVRYQRLYPEGDKTHLVGYLGNPNAREVRERGIYLTRW